MEILLTIQQTISQLANQCVLCGLCIPHCPTYHLFRTENESPRGRISLFKALAEEQFEASEDLWLSLDHCLTCRACEKICPSQVDYATLNNLGRALLVSQYPQHKRSLTQKMAEKLLVTQSLHPLVKISAKAVAPILSLFDTDYKHQSNKRQKPSTLGTMSHFSHEMLPNASLNPKLEEYYPASKTLSSTDSQDKQQVILFKGCSSDLFEQQTLNDAITLLNACQFNVHVPEKQQCCGAMNSRHGDIQGMNKLAQQNINQYKPLLQESEAILSITNSCSGQLKEYIKFFEQDDLENDARNFSHKATDIISFLTHAIKKSSVQFTPIGNKELQKIGVHIPCSLKNVLKDEQSLFDLLENIPNIQLIRINDQYCCGAAGSYMLQYPEIANRLIDEKIDDVIQHDYQTIVSSNIGCSLHFKDGIKRHEHQIGRKVEVIHPIHLLARQLIKAY